MGQEDAPATANLTRWPPPAGSNGFMIRHSARRRESHGNDSPSDYAASVLPRGWLQGLRAGPPYFNFDLVQKLSKEDDQWPGQPRSSLRSAWASRSTGICRPSSDPAPLVDPEWDD